MDYKRKTTIVFIIVSLFFFSKSQGQEKGQDSSYVHAFEKPNMAELYFGDYANEFNFTHHPHFHNNFRMTANSSDYLGLYLNYKWVTLKYSFAIPGTRLDNQTKYNYSSIRFRFPTSRMMFIPYFDTYNGLLLPNGKHEGYDAFRNIRFRELGLDYYYYLNPGKFSFLAANFFSAQQRRSAGAAFFMATPVLQQFNWLYPSHGLIRDSSTYRILSSSPEWVSGILRVGYQYSKVFDEGKWMISPAVTMGGGAFKELNGYRPGYNLVRDVQAWVTAGYNGPNVYAYMNAWWENLKTQLFVRDLYRKNTDLSLTIGYRFGSMHKKILGVL